MERDQAVHDRDALRSHLAQLASGSLPIIQADPPAPDSSASRKSKRSSSPSAVELPPKRLRAVGSSSSGPPASIQGKIPSIQKNVPVRFAKSASSTVPARSVGFIKRDPDASKVQAKPRKKPAAPSKSKGKKKIPTPPKGKNKKSIPTPPPSESSDDEEFFDSGDSLLAALSGSRSSSRRRGSTTGVFPHVESPGSPINVDTSSSTSESLSASPAPPASTKISKVDLFGEPSSDSEGAVSFTSESREKINILLLPHEYADLPATQKSRNQWIPGYRKRIPRSSAQVAPWSARRISSTCVAELEVDFLYKNLSKPKGYPFPILTISKIPPSDSLWTPRLVTSAQIAALYDQEPWKSLDTLVTPVSFPMTGCFDELKVHCLDFEDRHRQALWESTHPLYRSKEQRDSDPDLAKFYRERKQRRSRSGPPWKTVLRFVLRGIIMGLCDLDILLDPFFLHFPQSSEIPVWYPGFDCKQKNIPNLITALSLLDSVEPWRNQYRSLSRITPVHPSPVYPVNFSQTAIVIR